MCEMKLRSWLDLWVLLKVAFQNQNLAQIFKLHKNEIQGL